jgi:hypothetical protein
MDRSIDTAMGQHRPEKETMRQLWVEAVSLVTGATARSRAHPPLYLTLPGSEGLDIQQLIDRRIVRLAENHAIAPEDEWKVVAVERNSKALLKLKQKLPGLRVLNQDIKGMLASTEPLTWPQGEHEHLCRARVVNLDLDSSLRCEPRPNGRVAFPTVKLIGKFAQLHLKDPALDWMLCLTVAANIHWEPKQCEKVQSFLRENFQREERFALDSRALLGEDLFESLLSKKSLDMTTLSGVDAQALLMVFVPKKIIYDTYAQGWKIVTTRNLRYGGQDKSQRMVSWMMSFTHEPRVDDEPQAVYSENLAQTLARAGSIDPDGVLNPN